FNQPIENWSDVADIPPGLDKEAFFEVVRRERAFELCFEGYRKFDLIRWNMLGSSIRKAQAELKLRRSNYPYNSADFFVDGKHELFPIPIRERELNPNMTQNPNY